MRDEELKAAIASLQKSTANIDAQCATLEAQKASLLALRKESARYAASPAQSEHNTRLKRDRDQVNMEVEALQVSFNDRLSNNKVKVQAAQASTRNTIKDQLALDDRVLEKLERVAEHLQPIKTNDAQKEEVAQLCRALVRFRSATIRSHVDAVYQEQLYRPATNAAEHDDVQYASNKAELQGELESLHEEIASVAEMVVDQQLRSPIPRNHQATEKAKHSSQKEWQFHVLDTLTYLTARIDAITEHVVQLNSFADAVKTVGDAAGDYAGSGTAIAPVSLSKVTLRTATEDGEMSEASQQLLRHYNMQSNAGPSSMVVGMQLEQLERQQRLQEHYTSAQTSTVKAVSEVLSTFDTEVRAVVGSMYANTEYGTVSLGKQDHASRLSGLESNIGKTAKDVSGIDSMHEPHDSAKLQRFVDKRSER